ncbi:hypothetical protein BGX38DRAFT_1260152 [Terfezia claveryi]|nr:hypothetical protein BGX38DRAFT_1260152 [Terfezia claveryi]
MTTPRGGHSELQPICISLTGNHIPRTHPTISLRLDKDINNSFSRLLPTPNTTPQRKSSMVNINTPTSNAFPDLSAIFVAEEAYNPYAMTSTPLLHPPPFLDPFLALNGPWDDLDDFPLAEPQPLCIDPALLSISNEQPVTPIDATTNDMHSGDDIWGIIRGESLPYGLMEPNEHEVESDEIFRIIHAGSPSIETALTCAAPNLDQPNQYSVVAQNTKGSLGNLNPEPQISESITLKPLRPIQYSAVAKNTKGSLGNLNPEPQIFESITLKPLRPIQYSAVAKNTKGSLGNLNPEPQIVESTTLKPLRPIQYSAVAKNTKGSFRKLNPEPQIFESITLKPSRPIQPPQNAQAPRRTGVRLRTHSYSSRAQCVGQEQVHGNAGKKRQRKETGKPVMNVYKCDQCGELYDEIGKMTNHVKLITGHNYEEVTISWVGDGTVQPAKGFISGETYAERVRRQQAEKEAKREAKPKNKRKRTEPETQREEQAPNPSTKRRRAAAKTPEATKEPAPTKRGAPRKCKLEPKPKPN